MEKIMPFETFDIVVAFQRKLKLPEMNQLEDIAAVTSLMDYLSQDTSTTTIQEFRDNMEAAQAQLCRHTSSLPVRTTCEIFIRYITLSHLELENAIDFEECKNILLKQGLKFIKRCKQNSATIIRESENLIENGMVILTHSRSRLILGLMTDARRKGKRFRVLVTDGQPTCEGKLMVQELLDNGIKAEFIYDTEVASKMEKVDSVIVAAEGICEDGGSICRVGFFNIALAAKAFICKVHVLAETHKFSRLCSLSSTKIPKDVLYSHDTSNKECHPLVDYTPPSYVDTIVSDIGTLPTSVIGEYLLDLYT